MDATVEPERLRLLASAIGGRPLDVVPAEQGRRTWTDGHRIFLGDGAAADRIRMLAVQASLLAAGSLAPAVLRELSHRPALARRYLTVEGHRALAANEDVLPPLLGSLVDREVAAGLASAEASLAVARSRRDLGEPPEAFGTIEVRRTLAAMERAETSAARTDRGQTGESSTPTPPLAELDDLDDLDDVDLDDEGSLGDLLSSPVGGGGPIGRLLAHLFTPTRSRGGGGPPGADAPTRRGRAGPAPGGTRRATVAFPGDLEGESALAHRSGIHPEWDVHHARYRADWCIVHECDPPVEGVSTSTMVDTLGLRRSMAHLGMGLTRCRRRPQGDDVDIDAAVEACLDALAGTPHDDDVYLESLRRRRDLSVLVLLDVSGSAGEPGADGEPIHDQQARVAAALTAALHDLGDRIALYAFNSRGRKAVQLYRIKRFDDRLDATAARRLDGLRPGAYTRLGAAIRQGTAILADRGGTPRQLLVVLSDGFAYDHGYDGRYAEADARRALGEARRRGVGCVCLSVGSDADPLALRRVFGAASHAVVPNPTELPRLIGPLFRMALRSAEAQRRDFQRLERTKSSRDRQERR